MDVISTGGIRRACKAGKEKGRERNIRHPDWRHTARMQSRERKRTGKNGEISGTAPIDWNKPQWASSRLEVYGVHAEQGKKKYEKEWRDLWYGIHEPSQAAMGVISTGGTRRACKAGQEKVRERMERSLAYHTTARYIFLWTRDTSAPSRPFFCRTTHTIRFPPVGMTGRGKTQSI